MDAPTTTTLLEGLRRPDDRHAWLRFEEQFGPMIVGFARRLGLDEWDAQDAAQETMLAFVEAYRNGRYDREKGRLRNWLFGIAHRKVSRILQHRAQEAAVTDRPAASASLGLIASPDAAETVWEREWQRAILRACVAEVARQVEPTTFAAFELCVIQEHPTEKVAEQLGLTTNAVYIAKNRVMTRIREARRRIEETC